MILYRTEMSSFISDRSKVKWFKSRDRSVIKDSSLKFLKHLYQDVI